MGPNFGRNVTKFAPHKALNLIARGKSSFDERVVAYRVELHEITSRFRWQEMMQYFRLAGGALIRAFGPGFRFLSTSRRMMAEGRLYDTR